VTALADALPTLNAALNAASATLLFLGWRAIRAGRRDVHKRFMLAACGVSVAFLVSYLTRVALTGTHRFPGDGTLRTVYLFVLATHTVLAAATAPLAVRTLWLPFRQRFAEHRRIARWTLPVWMYVSVTGVAVYVMLYHLAPRLH
jgi:putative membrane protein